MWNTRRFTNLVDSAVQMYSGSRLSMHTDDVTAGLGKICHSLLWVHNHLHQLPHTRFASCGGWHKPVSKMMTKLETSRQACKGLPDVCPKADLSKA